MARLIVAFTVENPSSRLAVKFDDYYEIYGRKRIEIEREE